MGIVRLDDDGNMMGGAVAGSRPGDEAARDSRRARYYTPVTSTNPMSPVTVTTDGAHVAVSVGADTPRHYERGHAVEAGSQKPQVRNREMLGGQYAESEIAGRRDLQNALPPEQMDFLRRMAREGHAIIVENVAAPAATPRGTTVTSREK